MVSTMEAPMRHVITAIIALAALGFLSDGAWAVKNSGGEIPKRAGHSKIPVVQLDIHSTADIVKACRETHGKFNQDQEGGYGCATGKGSVHCGKDHRCIGEVKSPGGKSPMPPKDPVSRVS
jgi:hypothetical protein